MLIMLAVVPPAGALLMALNPHHRAGAIAVAAAIIIALYAGLKSLLE